MYTPETPWWRNRLTTPSTVPPTVRYDPVAGQVLPAAGNFFVPNLQNRAGDSPETFSALIGYYETSDLVLLLEPGVYGMYVALGADQTSIGAYLAGWFLGWSGAELLGPDDYDFGINQWLIPDAQALDIGSDAWYVSLSGDWWVPPIPATGFVSNSGQPAYAAFSMGEQVITGAGGNAIDTGTTAIRIIQKARFAANA